VLETLIKCGAFDRSGGAHRAAMYLAADEALAAGARLQRDRHHGQMNMFDLLAADPHSDPAWPQAEPWPENIRLNFEKEALGFFITGHPLDRFEVELELLDTLPIEKAKGRPDREVRLGGVVADLKTKKNKQGKDFAYLTLEDRTGSIEVLVWSSVLEKCQPWLANGQDQVVVVTGSVEAGAKAEDGEKGGNVKVKAQEILPLAEAFEKKTTALTLKLPRAGLDQENLALLSNAARNFRGSAKVFLHLAEPEGVAVYRLEATLRPCRELVENLGRLFNTRGRARL
jgi:DNA polymerase-3 subunit alpha